MMYDPDEPQDPGDGLSDERATGFTRFDSTKTDGFRLFLISLEVEKHAYAFCSPLGISIREEVPYATIHYN